MIRDFLIVIFIFSCNIVFPLHATTKLPNLPELPDEKKDDASEISVRPERIKIPFKRWTLIYPIQFTKKSD